MNPTYQSPREMRISQPGENSAPLSIRYPEIRGGTCEFCGVIDKNFPGDQQYKLCVHYKGMNLKCSFCKEGDDHGEVVRTSKMLVMSDPYLPGTLLTHCGKYECQRKFEKKFNLSN